MRIRYAAKTDVGMKRTHNEDYFSLIEDERLFVVADGMGGHSSGEVASRMAAETLGEFYRHSKDEEATWPYKMDVNMGYIENRLVTAVRMANCRIFESAAKDIRYKGMGTTLVACLLHDSDLYVAHVGDSRLYRLRTAAINQLTRDHSLLEDYKEARPDMTEEEERNFPHRNVITRALGMRDSVQVAIHRFEIENGDRFLMCSDGLSGMVADPDIARIVGEAGSLEVAVDRLVEEANKAGGMDNITVLLLQCDS